MRSHTRGARAWLSLIVAASAVVGSAAVVEATPADARTGHAPKIQHVRVVKTWPRSIRHMHLKPLARPGGVRSDTTWPVPSTVVHTLRARTAGSEANASSEATSGPVRVQIADAGTATPSASVRVTTRVMSRQLSAAAAVNGVMFAVTAPTSVKDLRVGLDYSQFADAIGGDFGTRLTLVRLPACAARTPQLPACRIQTPLPAHADRVRKTITTDLSRPARTAAAAGSVTTRAASSTVVLAAVSGASGPNGSFTATSLAPSGSWSVGGASGSFTWNYPITTPPVAAGSDVAPNVSLRYDSGSVDGRIADTNNQPSWIGEGWDYSPGYVERTFRTCSDDKTLTSANQTNDLCWAGPVLTLDLGGATNAIVRDDATGTYHLSNDDGSQVQLVGAGTGAYQNEYWKITEPSGVQYYFGRDTIPGGGATNATWTVPVYGAHSGDPCYHTGTFTTTSNCAQAWRWNLDYVVDPSGNATSYTYTAEPNWYGVDKATTTTSAMKYIRGGYLAEIDYGLRQELDANKNPSIAGHPASGKIVFGVSERCLSACTSFTKTYAANWPDTPQDQDCASGATCANHAPSFWSRKRLTSISTEYYAGTGSTYYMVDKYTLGQSFPTTGDPELELDTINRTAYPPGTATTATSGGTALPTVGLSYKLLANRVHNYQAQPDMFMWRLGQITTETGEAILVSYDQADRSQPACTATTVPSSPSTDTTECFPVYWTPVGNTTPILDYFHKHVVTEVDVDDRNGTAPNRYTTYTYVGSAAWHYDDNEIVKPANRTYGQFRGYGTVETRTGNPNNASNGATDRWTLSKTLYFRGMDGDTLPNGQTRSASVTDSLNNTVTDTNQFADTPREVQTFDGDGGAELTATLTQPEIVTTPTTPTRVRTGLPPLTATMVRPASTTTYTDLATGGTRSTTTSYDYDTAGRVQHQSDTGTGVDARCTTTHWAENTATSVWIRDRVSEKIVSAQPCPADDSGLTNILADIRTYYDGASQTDTPSTLGTVAARGLASETDTETTATPAPHWAVAKATYDGSGRVKTTTVTAGTGDDRTTTANYSPADGGPLTATSAINALGQSTQQTIDPSRGSILKQVDVATHATTATYDNLGRLTAVWRPGQIQGTNPATTTYSYVYGPTAPLAVITKTYVDPGDPGVGPAPGYITSVAIYDAFGQPRETQTSADGGGRNFTDTFHDSHGWVTTTWNHWHDSNSPSTVIPSSAGQSAVDDATETAYDGAGRPLTSTDYAGATPKWTATSVYSGDSTTVIPPAGGVETTTRTDSRGNTTELDEWTTPPTIANGVLTGGTARRTTYSHDPLGRQTGMNTAVGTAVAATWSTTYDLAGNIVRQVDPDAGATVMSYDDAGELISTTDANRSVLSTTYDALGRRSATYQGPADGTGTKLASWIYDTLQTGQLTSSTSYTSTGNYTQKVTGYDTAGNPLGDELDLSSPDTGFAAAYTTGMTWTSTHLLSTLHPATAGNLPDETIQYDYDSFGNPTATAGLTTNTYVSASSYTSYSEPAQYTVGINNHTYWLNYTRDPQTRRVTGLTYSGQLANPQIEGLTYAYDPAGNLTRSVDTQGDPADAAPVETNCYTYDALNELTAAWSATDNCSANLSKSGATNSVVGGPQPYWLTWTFDAASDRTQQINHAVPSGVGGDATTTYANGVTTPQAHLHALASTSTTGPVAATTGYTYDADGHTATRTINGTTQTIQYTPTGQTDNIALPGAAGTITYRYDAEGNQLLRRDPTSTTLYLPGEELTRDSTTGTITGTRYYTHNGTLVAVRVGRISLSNVITDPHGTADTGVYVTGTATGTIVRRHYDPYGNNLIAADGTTTFTSSPAGATWPDQHGYLNKPANTADGLSDLGARQYDPTNGRFLAVDPILDTTDPSQSNGYGYADANPVTNSDPSGKLCANGPDGTCRITGNSYSPDNGLDTYGAGTLLPSTGLSPDHNLGAYAPGGHQFNACEAACEAKIIGPQGSYKDFAGGALKGATSLLTAGGLLSRPAGALIDRFNSAIGVNTHSRSYDSGTALPIGLSMIALGPEAGAAEDATATALESTGPIGAAETAGVDIGSARFAQNDFSEAFSTAKGARFRGRTIDDVAGDLSSGTLSPKDVPIDVIVRDGNTLILNTRSSQALIRAGVPRSSWNVIDRTGQAAYESRLTGQLTRNGLTSYGTELP